MSQHRSMKLKFYFILIISVTISIHAFASLNRVKSSKYIEIKKYEVVDIVFKSTKSSCPFDVEFSVLFTTRNRIILFKVLNYSTLISLEKSPNHWISHMPNSPIFDRFSLIILWLYKGKCSVLFLQIFI